MTVDDAPAVADAPAISVVVPTFNRARSLERLLTAIDAAEVARVGAEIIVVDDGSTDDTGDVVLGHDELPVTLIRQPGAGPAAARNTGWRASHAPVVVFLDDDCVPLTGWLSGHLAAFDDPDVGGVGGSIVALVDGFVADFITADGLVDHGRPASGDADAAPTYLVTAHASFRRSVLEALDGFDERYRLDGSGRTGRIVAGEDVDLCWRLTAAGWRLALAPRAVVAHDHRTGLLALARTYFRHGRARRALGRAHPGRGAAAGFRRAASGGHWAARVRRYRDGGRRSWTRVGCFVVMRSLALSAYASGVGWSFLDDRRGRR